LMSLDEFCAANRGNWDERVATHRRDATGFYAVERFLAGEKRLHAIDSGELGGIAGKRLIHLQCHFGLDTLILAREGAVATGLDFSPAAIAEARRLAAEIGVAADRIASL
jgi:2-polyprenyl-3-methyl-5-hydroxy-6-metoxy-1,4-benzoquinol methylase